MTFLQNRDQSNRVRTSAMPRRMVLSDCWTVPWLEKWPYIFELLDIILIQMERRLNLRVAKSQPRRASSTTGTGPTGLHQASYLLCTFFACMTQDLKNAGMHWAPALGTCAAHAFAHARLAGVSREPVPGGWTQLCSGRIARQLAQA